MYTSANLGLSSASVMNPLSSLQSTHPEACNNILSMSDRKINPILNSENIIEHYNKLVNKQRKLSEDINNFTFKKYVFFYAINSALREGTDVKKYEDGLRRYEYLLTNAEILKLKVDHEI